MILFINKVRNYLITGRWIVLWKGEAYDSGQKSDGHNRMNPYGFHVVHVLSKRKTFNATYYTEHILEPILALHPKSGRRLLIIHADNARVHTTQRSQIFYDSNSLRIAPHSPHYPDSPDLAPSDFYLFEYLKHYLKGSSYLSEEAFLLRIYTILRSVPQTTLEDVFRNRMNRLVYIATQNDHYYP
jgi:hypothetical protein